MLTIVSVAYPLAPVSGDAIGGAEQILAALDRALVEHGHRSLVIACAGSEVRGELIAIPAPGDHIDTASHWAAHAACREAIAGVLAREQVDLVHLHGVDFYRYVPRPPTPVLATLHLPLASYPVDALEHVRPGMFLHGVSHAQTQRFPRPAAMLPPIANGVDLEVLRPVARPGRDAVVLGRICREKGQHLALDAAIRADVSLVLAGKVFGFAEHERYHAEEIVPRLDDRRRFIGPVGGARKTQLIAEAGCLIVPSVIEETSSLVAMEALACGTPVIAFRRGALAELVDHGVTGWLVDSVGELAVALREVDRLDRARCRAVAEARCARDRMCREYLARYQLLAATPPAVAPRARAPELLVRVIDRDGLAALVPAWSALADRCPDATVFQRPEWLMPWCKHELRGTVESFGVWCDGILVGLLPLFRWRDGNADVLSLLGAGVSDYQDALVDPGCDGAALGLARAVAGARWDRLELSELREGSCLLALELPGERHRVAQDRCPALPIAAGLPPGLQRELAYQRRRAAREIGIAIGRDVVPGDVVGALAELHAARWSARGEGGALASTTRRAFLADAVDHVAARDALVVAGVRFGGALAAIAIGFLDRDTVRYYLGGFDPRYELRSPGNLAIAALIDEAARRGATTFDFLRGDEAYKYRFGARDHAQLHRLIVARRTTAPLAEAANP